MGNQQGKPGRTRRKRSREGSEVDVGLAHEEKRRPEDDWELEKGGCRWEEGMGRLLAGGDGRLPGQSWHLNEQKPLCEIE